MGVKKSGYNIFASGPTGTGRTLTIRNFVRSRCQGDAVPDDWVYVFNFETAYRPQPIALPPGQGKAFQEAMKQVVTTLKTSVSAVIDAWVRARSSSVRSCCGRPSRAARARSISSRWSDSVIPLEDEGRVVTSES